MTDVKPGQLWRHHSGYIYKVLFLTNTEGDGVRDKYPPTVVYQGENGKKWSGPLSDWHRRMTLISDIGPPEESAGAEPFNGHIDEWRNRSPLIPSRFDTKYPFCKMSVGDSFFAPADNEPLQRTESRIIGYCKRLRTIRGVKWSFETSRIVHNGGVGVLVTRIE